MRATREAEPLLTSGEVADLFGVDVKTVAKWSRAGKLTTFRTLGNHRRFKEAEVRALLEGSASPRVLPAGHPDVYRDLGYDESEDQP